MIPPTRHPNHRRSLSDTTDQLLPLVAGPRAVGTRSKPTVSVGGLTALLATLLAFSPASQIWGQQTTTPAGEQNEPEQTYVLSPFVVNAEDDTGYAATSTLAGSRLKTDLKDTAASISVLTREFLDDIAANNLEEALLYSTSTQPDLADASADGVGPNGNIVQGNPTLFKVRGQPTSQARNYFTVKVKSDNYNVERIEDSRGPNSVLFGFGSPGGILNVSTKQARIDRSFQRATLQSGSHESHREALDFNQVLVKGKLAFRLNALYDESRTFQHFAINRDRRFDFAVKYQASPTLQFRASYEQGEVFENKSRPFAAFDGGVLLWFQVGSPTSAAFITNNALSITRFNNSRRPMHIGNTGQLIEAAGTMTTLSTPVTIMDRSIADPSINYGGPGQTIATDLNSATAVMEKRLGANTFIEIAYNHQERHVVHHDPSQTNMRLWGDPNQKIKVAPGAVLADNPFVGGLFFDNSSGPWRRNTTDDKSDVVRATLSTEFDAGKWGNYRLAALGEHDWSHLRRRSEAELWVGAPFNATPENAANHVRRRNYVVPGDWSTYHLSSPQSDGFISAPDPVTGAPLQSAWLPGNAQQENNPSTLKSMLVGGQARYFNSKLVFGGGFRTDKYDLLNRDPVRDPVTNLQTLVGATEERIRQEADNASFGVMWHVKPWISVFYNRASNQGLGAGGNRMIIDKNNLLNAVLVPNTNGEGMDAGIALTLFDGKIHARATYYTTDGTDLSVSYGVNGIGPSDASENIMDTLEGAGLVTQAERDAHISNANSVLFDQSSEGYELNVTANLTKNWRLQANYSLTDTNQTNFGNEIRAWHEQEVAYWRSFNAGSLRTSDSNRTIDEAIQFMLDGYARDVAIGDAGELGLRRHKISLFTRYDLRGDRLKGTYIGGGYRYQSRNLTEVSVDGSRRYYGPAFERVDLLLGYRFPKSVFQSIRFLEGLTLQLNVFNVLDDDDYLITRTADDGTNVRRATPQDGRTWRLQANLEF